MKNFIEWLINEMPINKFNLVGDWGPKAPKRGFDKPSIGILTSPKGVQKIRNMWSKTEVDFDMYFVRQPNAMKFVQMGEVNSAWLKDNLNINLQPNPEAVTILFTQNLGNEKVPMTAWTIGHRAGHAFARGKGYTNKCFTNFTRIVREKLSEIFEDVYGHNIPKQSGFTDDRSSQKKLHFIAQALGSMKSARDGNLRDYGEFVYELLGQYIISGKITFRMPPPTLGNRNQRYRNQLQKDFEQPEVRHMLEFMEDVFNQQCEIILHSAVGKMFVM